MDGKYGAGDEPQIVQGTVISVGDERHEEREALSVTYNRDQSETWTNSISEMDPPHLSARNTGDFGGTVEAGRRRVGKGCMRYAIGALSVAAIVLGVVIVVIAVGGGGGDTPQKLSPTRGTDVSASGPSPPSGGAPVTRPTNPVPPPPVTPGLPPTPPTPVPPPVFVASHQAPTLPVSSSSVAQIALVKDLSTIPAGSSARASFEADFVADAASFLGVPASRLAVVSIHVGGQAQSGRRLQASSTVVVVLEIKAASGGTPPSTLLSQLRSGVVTGLSLGRAAVASVDSAGNRLGEAGHLSLYSNNDCAVQERRDRHGQSCGDFVSHGYKCFDLRFLFGYDCRCSCTRDHRPKDTTTWVSVNFTQPMANPVVVAGLASHVDPGDAFIRLRSVGAHGFEIALQEARCQDRRHPAEEVSWLAIEAGAWYLPAAQGGAVQAQVQAGVATLAHGSRKERWHDVKLNSSFGASTPMVISQLMTTNEVSAPAWSRVTSISASGFQIALQEDDWDGQHLIEKAGWIVFAGGARQLHRLGSRHSFEVGQATVPAVAVGANPSPTSVPFASSFTDTPLVFGSIVSTNACCSDTSLRCDTDAVSLRLSNVNSRGASVRVKEVACPTRGPRPATSDSHNNHEQIMFLALGGGAGPIFAPLVGCDGATNSNKQKDVCGICGGSGTSGCLCWRETTFNFISLAGADPGVTEHNLGDDGFADVHLPWRFTSYGQQYASIRVSANGYFTFGHPNQHSMHPRYGNTWPIPSDDHPSPIVAVYWADLDAGSPTQSNLARVRTGSPSSTTFVVEWSRVPYWKSNDQRVSFEAVLYRDGRIVFQYDDIAPSPDHHQIHAPVSIGVSNLEGDEGVQVAFDVDLSARQLAIELPSSCFVQKGCDGSGGVVDTCGVCGGDGSSCARCPDPLATNYDSGAPATAAGETCRYNCAAAAASTPAPVWGGAYMFVQGSSRPSPADDDVSQNKVILHGQAFVDQWGLHVDGATDMAAVGTGNYPTVAFSDATVSFSFWFTKMDCSGEVYEYMWSQTKRPRVNIMSRSNSNINVFMSCGANGGREFLDAAGVGNARAAFLRVNMIDSQGSLLNYDWVLHPSGANPILSQWFSVTLSITPTSIQTFLDGAPVGKFGFHPTVALCHLNAAYPDPRTLNVALSGFDFGERSSSEPGANLFLGGRGDGMTDRHFRGAIAGTTIYDQALSRAQARCVFTANTRSGHIRQIPQHLFGCTDPKASNYNRNATVQSGSCTYPQPCWVKTPLMPSTGSASSKWIDAARLVGQTLRGSRRRQMQASMRPGTRQCASRSDVICRYTMADDGHFNLPLPFAFRWFGTDSTHIEVSANGFVVFTTNTTMSDQYMGRASSTTRAIPNPTPPNNAAFVLWTDLDPSSGGLIFTWADADRLVVEWNSPHYSTQPSIGAPNANFQIVLHRATNNVTFNYQQHQTVSAPVWAPISVGVENAAGDGGSSGRGGSVQMAFGDPVAPEPGSSVLWPGSCVM